MGPHDPNAVELRYKGAKLGYVPRGENELPALLTRLLFGGQIDRWGVKRALGIGSAVNAAAMALYLVPMGSAISR